MKAAREATSEKSAGEAMNPERKSLNEVVTLLLCSPFFLKDVSPLNVDLKTNQKIFLSIIVKTFPMVSTQAFLRGGEWYITIQAHPDDFEYMERIRIPLGLMEPYVLLEKDESLRSHFDILSYSDCNGSNEEVLKLMLMHFERLYPCSTILQIYDKSSLSSVIIAATCEDARDATSKEINNIFTKICMHRSMLSNIQDTIQERFHCMVGIFEEHSGRPIISGHEKNTIVSIYPKNESSADTIKGIEKEKGVPIKDTYMVGKDGKSTLKLSGEESPPSPSTEEGITVITSLSGFVRKWKFLWEYHFLVTAGHGSVGVPDTVSLWNSLPNDSELVKQKAVIAGPLINRMWPSNLDEKMKGKSYSALYNPSQLGDEQFEADYKYIKKCVSDVAVFETNHVGLWFKDFKTVEKFDMIKRDTMVGVKERIRFITVPSWEEYSGKVSFKGAITPLGSMTIVGRGHRCFFTGSDILYEVFYLAQYNGSTPSPGDSGSACFNEHGGLHSFYLGDVKLHKHPAVVSLEDEYGYLTPAHFCLEQVNTFINDNERTVPSIFPSSDLDFVDIAFHKRKEHMI